MFRYFLLFGISLLYISCNEEEVSIETLINDTPYYPTHIGHYNEYLIQEIAFYDEGRSVDTFSYYTNEKVVGTATDQLGTNLYLIDQYMRHNDSEDWVYHNRITVAFRDNQLIRTEGNIPLIKMSLPANLDKNWLSTSLFDPSIEIMIKGEPIDYYKSWQSRYLTLDESEMINGVTYESTHTIQLADLENRLERRYAIEKYAKDIGLIYSERKILNTQCFDQCQNTSWEEKAEKGIIQIQTRIE